MYELAPPDSVLAIHLLHLSRRRLLAYEISFVTGINILPEAAAARPGPSSEREKTLGKHQLEGRGVKMLRDGEYSWIYRDGHELG